MESPDNARPTVKSQAGRCMPISILPTIPPSPVSLAHQVLPRKVICDFIKQQDW